jgi:hypothetical protein
MKPTLSARDLMHDSNSQAGARDLPAVSSTSARLPLSRGQVTDARTEAEAGIAAMEAGGSRELSADLVACAALTTWLGRDETRLWTRSNASTASQPTMRTG